MTMASDKETGRTQELADVISNILDLWDDDKLPLALEKMKIHSIDAMVDYTVEDIEDMVYDEDNGLKMMASHPSTRLNLYQMDTKHL
jgi:hypothetical protein